MRARRIAEPGQGGKHTGIRASVRDRCAPMRLIALALCLVPSAALAASGGPLGTLMLGRYECERPGPPAEPGVPEPGWSFAVTTSSRYVAAAGEGTYLLTGDTLTMTSGPLDGTRLIRLRGGFLRVLENGKPGPVRCILLRRSDKH